MRSFHQSTARTAGKNKTRTFVKLASNLTETMKIKDNIEWIKPKANLKLTLGSILKCPDRSKTLCTFVKLFHDYIVYEQNVQDWYRLEFCSVRAMFVRHLRGSNQSARVTPLLIMVPFVQYAVHYRMTFFDVLHLAGVR